MRGNGRWRVVRRFDFACWDSLLAISCDIGPDWCIIIAYIHIGAKLDSLQECRRAFYEMSRERLQPLKIILRRAGFPIKRLDIEPKAEVILPGYTSFEESQAVKSAPNHKRGLNG